MSARTTSAPFAASAFALSLFGSRVIARHEKPPEGSDRIARASAPPCAPVAPTTAMTFVFGMMSPDFGSVCLALCRVELFPVRHPESEQRPGTSKHGLADQRK